MSIRFGVVGTGYWAKEVHAAGLAASADAELVGVYGRDPVKTGRVAGPLGVRAFTSYEDLIDEVDAVAFAVPPTVQAPLAVRAAEAGRHLLLEKPIAMTVPAADQLATAATDVATVVFFTGRFVPVWESWLDEVSEQPLLGGRAEWLTTMEGTPFAASPWRNEEGALWDVGPHALSFLLPALGPVVAVAGSRGRGDLVHLVLTHESGATSTMALSMTMPARTSRISVEVYGESGFLARPEDERDVAAAYGQMVAELVAAIRAGRTTHRCDVRFGRDVVEVLARCETAVGPAAGGRGGGRPGGRPGGGAGGQVRA